MQLYHKSNKANYFKYPNGIVKKVYNGKNPNMKTTFKVSVSNDHEGLLLIETAFRPMGIKRLRYRCPNDGKKYPAWGFLPKERAKVIDVYLK
jgi:hypothetical protein